MTTSGTLRVLTWNVRDMLGDPLAVHRVLRAADADVACLQEVPRWPRSRPRLAALARECGMFYACGGGESAGTALLAGLRVDVRTACARRLPVRGWLTRPRGWAGAVVRLTGTRPVALASIHLGLSAPERADHVARLLALAASVDVPVVLAGDLNEPPGGPSWSALLVRLRDPGADGKATFPAARPRRRIDAVLVDPALPVTCYGWPSGVHEADVVAGSDHRPVIADVSLPLEIGRSLDPA